jgi:hypothetical protein
MLVGAPPDHQPIWEIALEVRDLLLQQLRLAKAAELALLEAYELAPIQLGKVNRKFLA